MFQTVREFRKFKQIIEVSRNSVHYNTSRLYYFNIYMSIKQKTYIYSIVRHLRHFAHPKFFPCGLKGLIVMFYIYIYIHKMFVSF